MTTVLICVCMCVKEKWRWEPSAGQNPDGSLKLRTDGLTKESEEDDWDVG